MISVVTEDEAVWFSFLTLNRVLAFVSAAVKPAQAAWHLARLRGLPGPASLCVRGERGYPRGAGAAHKDGF